MIDPKLNEALGHVRAPWDDERMETALAGLGAKRRRRAVVRGGAALASVAVLAVTIGFVLNSSGSNVGMTNQSLVAEGSSANKHAEANRNGAFYLPDGSSGVPADDESRLTVVQVSEDLVAVRVDEGRCDFEVMPQDGRRFEVRSNSVNVSVLGTKFSVENVGDQTHVRVGRGRVRVEWPGGSEELVGGSEGTFPPDQSGVTSDAGLESEQQSSKPGRVARRKPGRDWRGHARSGEFEEAAGVLMQRDDVKNTVEDLLLAADAMRLSGHPNRAIEYLEKVLQNHNWDPRVTLAEFTRGRILLIDLGQPRSAALAFRSVRLKKPEGNMAQNALAREVEAWYRAGELDTAHNLALEYAERYPNGRRIRAVKRFGALE